MTETLLFFVKYPEPGRVKTRLAREVGEEEAARIYRSLVESNLKELRALNGPAQVVIAFDPPEAEEKVRSWLPGFDAYLPQVEGGLTERLSAGFQTAFNEGAAKVLALGSDTIGLKAGHVTKAFEALERYDVVLGPAKDGGYYLIGLSQPEPALFEKIPWSTSQVLSTTLSRAKERGLSFFLLEELEDLDESQNLKGVTL